MGNDRSLEVLKKHVMDNVWDRNSIPELVPDLPMSKINTVPMELIEEDGNFVLATIGKRVIFDTDPGVPFWNMYTMERGLAQMLDFSFPTETIEPIVNYLDATRSVQILTEDGRILGLHNTYVQLGGAVTDGESGELLLLVPYDFFTKAECSDKVLYFTAFGEQRAFPLSNYKNSTTFINPTGFYTTVNGEIALQTGGFYTHNKPDAYIQNHDSTINTNDSFFWTGITSTPKRYKADDTGKEYVIMHMPKYINPERKVIPLELCDVFLVWHVAGGYNGQQARRGVCLNRECRDHGIQLTHSDYGIPKDIIDKYVDAFTMGTRNISIVPYIGITDNLGVLDDHRIEKLYDDYTDAEIINLLDTPKASTVNWQWSADYLHNHPYGKLLKDITPRQLAYNTVGDYIDILGPLETMKLLGGQVFDIAAGEGTNIGSDCIVAIALPPLYDNKAIDITVYSRIPGDTTPPSKVSIISSVIDDISNMLVITLANTTDALEYRINITEISESQAIMVLPGTGRKVLRHTKDYIIQKLILTGNTSPKYKYEEITASLTDYVSHVEINDIAYINFDDTHSDTAFIVSFGYVHAKKTSTVKDTNGIVVVEQAITGYAEDNINVRKISRGSQLGNMLGDVDIIRPNYAEVETYPLREHGVLKDATGIDVGDSIFSIANSYLPLSGNNVWLTVDRLIIYDQANNRLVSSDTGATPTIYTYDFTDEFELANYFVRTSDNVIFCVGYDLSIIAIQYEDNNTFTLLDTHIVPVHDIGSERINIVGFSDTEYIVVGSDVCDEEADCGFILRFPYTYTQDATDFIFEDVRTFAPIYDTYIPLEFGDDAFFDDNDVMFEDDKLSAHNCTLDPYLNEMFIYAYDEDENIIIGHINKVTFDITQVTQLAVTSRNIAINNGVFYAYVDTGMLTRVEWDIDDGFTVHPSILLSDIPNATSPDALPSSYAIHPLGDFVHVITYIEPTQAFGPVTHWISLEYDKGGDIYTATELSISATPYTLSNIHLQRTSDSTGIIIGMYPYTIGFLVTISALNWTPPVTVSSKINARFLLEDSTPHPECIYTNAIEVIDQDILRLELEHWVLNSINGDSYFPLGIRLSYGFDQNFSYTDPVLVDYVDVTLVDDGNIVDPLYSKTLSGGYDPQGYEVSKVDYELNRVDSFTLDDVNYPKVPWDDTLSNEVYIPLHNRTHNDNIIEVGINCTGTKLLCKVELFIGLEGSEFEEYVKSVPLTKNIDTNVTIGSDVLVEDIDYLVLDRVIKDSPKQVIQIINDKYLTGDAITDTLEVTTLSKYSVAKSTQMRGFSTSVTGDNIKHKHITEQSYIATNTETTIAMSSNPGPNHLLVDWNGDGSNIITTGDHRSLTGKPFIDITLPFPNKLVLGWVLLSSTEGFSFVNRNISIYILDENNVPIYGREHIVTFPWISVSQLNTVDINGDITLIPAPGGIIFSTIRIVLEDDPTADDWILAISNMYLDVSENHKPYAEKLLSGQGSFTNEVFDNIYWNPKIDDFTEPFMKNIKVGYPLRIYDYVRTYSSYLDIANSVGIADRALPETSSDIDFIQDDKVIVYMPDITDITDILLVTGETYSIVDSFGEVDPDKLYSYMEDNGIIRVRNHVLDNRWYIIGVLSNTQPLDSVSGNIHGVIADIANILYPGFGIYSYSNNTDYVGKWKPPTNQVTEIGTMSFGGEWNSLMYMDDKLYTAEYFTGAIRSRTIAPPHTLSTETEIIGVATVNVTVGEFSRSMTYDGEFVYVGYHGGLIEKYTKQFVLIGSVISISGANITGLHAYGGDLYAVWQEGNILYRIDLDTATYTSTIITSSTTSTDKLIGLHVFDTVIVIGAWRGELYAFDKHNLSGSEIWNTEWNVGGGDLPIPATQVFDDLVYVHEEQAFYLLYKNGGLIMKASV